MFTTTQKNIYKDCQDRIETRLEQLTNGYIDGPADDKCKIQDMSDSSKIYNVLMYLLSCSMLYNQDVISEICDKFIPNNTSLKTTFRNLSGLFNFSLENHNFFIQICDERLMKVGPDAPSTQELKQHFSDNLKKDLSKWYRQTCEK
jgi:hypothetical protein